MHKVIAENGRDRQHRQLLSNLLEATEGPVRIASAYITDTTLFHDIGKRQVQLMTSLSAFDIISGATSIESLKSLIEAGVQCRWLSDRPRLHAKVYIFGDDSALVTSANLTKTALDLNIEAGVEVVGTAVSELVRWFDAHWKEAKRLDVALISAWQKQFVSLKSEYARLLQKTATKVLQSNETSSVSHRRTISSHKLLDKMTNHGSGDQVCSFLCNTGRKDRMRTSSGGFKHEERMHESGYAAAWHMFSHRDHMERVKPGDLIFMYANGAGIIGIGEAKGTCDILKRNDPGRIRNDEPIEEWRIPVEWLFWDNNRPCPWKPHSRTTFTDVSGHMYDHRRAAILKHLQLLGRSYVN